MESFIRFVLDIYDDEFDYTISPVKAYYYFTHGAWEPVLIEGKEVAQGMIEELNNINFEIKMSSKNL